MGAFYINVRPRRLSFERFRSNNKITDRLQHWLKSDVTYGSLVLVRYQKIMNEFEKVNTVIVPIRAF